MLRETERDRERQRDTERDRESERERIQKKLVNFGLYEPFLHF